VTTTATLQTQLRTLLDLTNTEIQVAETRVAQARTEAVRRELTQNAGNARHRAEAITRVLRDLGGCPSVTGPLFGRAAALVKTMVEQAQPFDEALLGDLQLEHQLLDRARYVKALAVAAGHADVEALADRLVTAHSATVEWLTTVLAELALGGPAALRRTPLQAAAGAAVRLVNAPVNWTARGLDRAVATVRSVPRPTDAFTRTVSPDVEDLPIDDYDALNVAQAVAAVKDLEIPADIRNVIAYEEAHKDRHGVVSAAQTRLAAIAQDVVGINT